MDERTNSEEEKEQATRARASAHGLLALALAPELDADVEGNAEEQDLEAGDVVGAYTLVKPLGKGGFGVVWKAVQSEPIRREVAIKIIRAGMNSRSVIARFRLERQALALMSHSYIAKVLDAGSTLQNRPYFAMELVNGVAITKYARDNNLTVKQSLELMLSVCEAVEHAHQKGVLHRDLKPTNILVAEMDGRPVPKIIDFGIAKALHAEVQCIESLAFTAHGVLLGTPFYMAPEHATLGSDQVDVRADVFSLGAILYELLTHRLPVEIANAKNLPANELFRRICETELTRPSTRIMKSGSFKEASTQAAVLLKSELDWLVLKALEKKPENRYPGVYAFAQDIQRYLQDEPLSVGPPSTWYRVRKLAQRHRAAFAISAVVLTSLLIIAVMSSISLRRESRARAVAEKMQKRAEQSEEALLGENQKARRLVSFLSGLLDQAGKHVDEGRNPEALRLALDESTLQLERFDAQPEVQATLCESLAKVYVSMGDFARALPLLYRQQSICAGLFGADDSRTQRLSLTIAKAEIDVNVDHAKALTMLDYARRCLEKSGEDRSRDWFETTRYLAIELSVLGMHEQALTMVTELSQHRNGRNLPATEDIAFVRSMAEIQRRAGDLSAAEATLRAGLGLVPSTVKSRKERGERARLLQALARLEVKRGQIELAAQHFDEALPLERFVRGARSVKLTDPLIEGARLHAELGRIDQALSRTGEALSIARETGDVAEQMHSLRATGDILEEAKRPAEALPHRRECEVLGRDQAPTMIVWFNDLLSLGLLLSELNQHHEAEEKAIALWAAIGNHPDVLPKDRDKEIMIYEGLIKILDRAQTAFGNHSQDALLAAWQQKLQSLKRPLS